MLMVHFAPEHALRDIVRVGIRVSNIRKDPRKCGVYALPLLPGVPFHTSRMWKKVLRGDKRGNRLVAIVFRVHDDEIVHYHRDWDDMYMVGHQWGGTVRAREAGRRFLGEVQLAGGIPCCTPEVVIPRHISPKEIIRFELRKKRDRMAA